MPPEDAWSVATAEDDGMPLLFRIRNTPPAFARPDDFPNLLAVTWRYESPTDAGMPAEDDVTRMGELEDLLIEAFEGARQAFLTVVATGNGVREWQWYARNPQDVMELVNQALGELEPFPVEFCFQDDPEWEAYAQFRG